MIFCRGKIVLLLGRLFSASHVSSKVSYDEKTYYCGNNY